MSALIDPAMYLTPTIRLVQPIGRGGMASIWLARNEALGADVAVKIMKPSLKGKHPHVIERMKREAAISARIDSPHVVRVFDLASTGDGLPYIVMELLRGETLDDRLTRGELLSLRETAQLIRQVTEVLSASHAIGAVHRDIKPANLWLLDTPELFVKVLDFGLVKDEHGLCGPELTTTGLVVGSPRYMSPEQFLGSVDLDGRADLWSLGVVAYRALAGRHPFEQSQALAVANAVLNEDFKPPSAIAPHLSSALDAFFRRAFRRRVSERFQTASEMSAAFDDLIAPCAATITWSDAAIPVVVTPPTNPSPPVHDATPQASTSVARGRRPRMHRVRLSRCRHQSSTRATRTHAANPSRGPRRHRRRRRRRQRAPTRQAQAHRFSTTTSQNLDKKKDRTDEENKAAKAGAAGIQTQTKATAAPAEAYLQEPRLRLLSPANARVTRPSRIDIGCLRRRLRGGRLWLAGCLDEP